MKPNLISLVYLYITITSVIGLEIDSKRCLLDTACFAIESCWKTSTSDTFNEITQNSFQNKVEKCAFTVQNKPYSTEKLLIIMEVSDAIPIEDEKNATLMIYKGADKLFGCSRKDGKLILEDGRTYATDFEIKMFEGSYLKTNSIVCAFTISKMTSFTQHLATLPVAKLSIKVFPDDTSAHLKEYSAEGHTNYFFDLKLSHVTCNPDDIVELPFVDNTYYVEPLREKQRSLLECSNIPELTFSLYYFKEDDETPYSADSLSCVGKKWEITSGTDVIGVDSSKHRFICGTPITRKCKTLCSDPNCPTFVEATKDADPSLKCPDDKWYIDHEYHVDVTTQCVKDFDKPNSALFMMTFTRSNTQDQLPISARCFKDYNCNEKSPLQLDDCKENDENDKLCNELQIETDSFSCKDAIPLLLSQEGNDTTPLTTTAVKCDKATGDWKDSEGKVVPIGTYVKCKENAREEKKADLTTGSMTGILVAICTALILIAVGAITVWLYSRKKRKESLVKISKKKWKKMKPEDRVKKIQELFNDFCKITPISNGQITDALTIIEMVLHSENEQPAVWAIIFNFITKFHGTSHASDRIHRLFCRWCLNEAKKIIDKIGWTSERPLTNENHQGYLRIVAIQLIGLALNSNEKAGDEAHHLLLEGFSILKFSLVNQYPHAGLLVATLMQNSTSQIDVGGEKFGPFNNLSEELFTIIKHLPLLSKTETMDEFGTMEKQIVIAMSRSRDVLADKYRAKFLIRNYVECTAEGFITAIHPDPCKIYCTLTPKEKGLKLIKQFSQTANFVKICKTNIDILVNFGKNIDAKNLFEALCINEENLTDYYNKKRREWDSFCAAFEAKNENIASWFEERVGKDTAETGEYQPSADTVRAAGGKEETKEVTGANAATAVAPTGTTSASDSAPPNPTATNSGTRNEKKMCTYDEMRTEHPCGLPQVLYDYGKKIAIPSYINKPIKASDIKDVITTRQKDCTASPEDVAEYRKILESIFQKRIMFGDRIDFAPLQIAKVLQAVAPILNSEPSLIEDIPLDINVVGDLHGQLRDLDRIFKQVAKNMSSTSPGWENGTYLFLGDYVDRGRHSLEIVMTLFILKILFPNRFFLLRGNHEFFNQNVSYGFFHELAIRYGETAGSQIWAAVNRVFGYLSVAGIVGGRFFCAHGGISTSGMTRSQIRRLPKPIHDHTENSIVFDLVWADPMEGLHGSCHNAKRGISIFFGEDTLKFALSQVGCTALLRGHSMVDGFADTFGRCFTIFSCPGIGDNGTNDGGFIYIDANREINIYMMKYDPARRPFLRSLERSGGVQAGDVTVEDEKGIPVMKSGCC